MESRVSSLETRDPRLPPAIPSPMQRATLALMLVLLLALPACSTAPRRLAAELDGAKIQYVDRGWTDDAIVFVHGWASDRSVWVKQLDAFPDRRVIALDLV